MYVFAAVFDLIIPGKNWELVSMIFIWPWFLLLVLLSNQIFVKVNSDN